MHEKVKLLTSSGEFVTEIEMVLIKFKKDTSIMWGSRVFVYNEAEQGYYETVLFMAEYIEQTL